MKGWMAVLVLAGALGGCKGASPLQTEQYSVELTAVGPVMIPTRVLGTVAIPTLGLGLIDVAIDKAGEHLKLDHSLAGCTFHNDVPTFEGRVLTETATASCLLHGLPIREVLTLVLRPVAR